MDIFIVEMKTLLKLIWKTELVKNIVLLGYATGGKWFYYGIGFAYTGY